MRGKKPRPRFSNHTRDPIRLQTPLPVERPHCLATGHGPAVAARMQTISLTDAPQNHDRAIAIRVLKHVRYPPPTPRMPKAWSRRFSRVVHTLADFRRSGTHQKPWVPCHWFAATSRSGPSRPHRPAARPRRAASDIKLARPALRRGLGSSPAGPRRAGSENHGRSLPRSHGSPRIQDYTFPGLRRHRYSMCCIVGRP